MSTHIYNVKLFDYKRRLEKPTQRQLLPVQRALGDLPPLYIIPVPIQPYDQGPIGSCTANAICHAFLIQLRRSIPLSRLFEYYNSRFLSHSVGSEGAYLDDTFRALQQYGTCREKNWAYIIAKQNVRPTTFAFREAKMTRVLSWGVVSSIGGGLIANLKQVLIQNKPVVFGILVYSSFESPVVTTTGMVPVPNVQRERLLGGHAMTMVGFDDAKSAFLVINSWGKSWGCKYPGTQTRGYCYVPYAYIANPTLCDECFFMSAINLGPELPPPPKPRPRQRKRRRRQRRRRVR